MVGTNKAIFRFGTHAFHLSYTSGLEENCIANDVLEFFFFLIQISPQVFPVVQMKLDNIGSRDTLARSCRQTITWTDDKKVHIDGSVQDYSISIF